MLKGKLLKSITSATLIISSLVMATGAQITKAEEKVKSSHIVSYACEARAPLVGNVNVPMEVEINALVPEMVHGNESFTIEDSYTKVTILDTGLLKVAANEVKGKVIQFNLEIDSAIIADHPEASTINVAEQAIPIPPTPFSSGDTVTFRVPEEGGIDVGELIAAENGVVTVKAGTITTDLDTNLGTITANCSPTGNNVLNKIGIDHIYVPDEEEDEENGEVSFLDEALRKVESIAGKKNAASKQLNRLQLDEWRILPSDQASKVKEALKEQVNNNEIDIEVHVSHPLTAVVGTSVTQAFTVTLIEGNEERETTVHASFIYAHEDRYEEQEQATDLQLATKKLQSILGSQNNPAPALRKLKLDAGKILPQHQATKVKQAIEQVVDEEKIDVQVKVIHPLTTVIGTDITQVFKVTLSDGKGQVTEKVHASFVYNHQNRDVEEEVVDSFADATSLLGRIQGAKNKPSSKLQKIGLDAWRILPSHQAQKLERVIETTLHNEGIKGITVEASVIHPLTTVIGTNITQAFTVTISNGDQSTEFTVHASFRY